MSTTGNGKLGISVPGLNQPIDAFPVMSKTAEDAGFDSGRDYECHRTSFAVHGLTAQATSRITMGTGLAAVAGRSPFEMANAVADVDEVLNGRALLGMSIGAGGWSELLNGVDIDHPCRRSAARLSPDRRSRSSPCRCAGRRTRRPSASSGGSPASRRGVTVSRRALTEVTRGREHRHAQRLRADAEGPPNPRGRRVHTARDIVVERVLVDAMAAQMVSNLGSIDVVVASNLFGDILTDLGGAIQGSLGLAASANLVLGGGGPSMFEPVHGSAPDIAGQGCANPIGAVWPGALMLRELGHPAEADDVEQAIAAVCGGRRTLTRDCSGSASTREVGDALVAALR